MEAAVCLQPNSMKCHISWLKPGGRITLTDKSKVPHVLTRWIVWKIEGKQKWDKEFFFLSKKKTKQKRFWHPNWKIWILDKDAKISKLLVNIYIFLKKHMRSINYPLTIPEMNWASFCKDIRRLTVEMNWCILCTISFLLDLTLPLHRTNNSLLRA